MASFNRVILAGNLTRDPQLKYLPSNTAVCEFGMAMNHKWRDKDGNQREDVCFVDVAFFGRAGEVINQYMGKGRPILVEGRLKLDQWTSQDGQKRSKLSVVGENFTFLGQGQGQGGGAGGSGGEGDTAGQEYGQPSQQRGGYSGGGGGGYGQARSATPRSAPPARQAAPPQRNDYGRAPAAEPPPQEDGPPSGYQDEGDRPPGGDDIPF